MASIQNFRYAYHLAREGNFKRAALELHISQPALSKGIACLEEEFGVELFDRKSRPVKPTPAGLLLLKEAERLLNGQHELKQQLIELKGRNAGRLSVAWGPYAYAMYARTFAERFHQQFPQVELQYQLVSWDKGPLKMDRGEVNLVVADITSLNPAQYSLIPLVQREIKMICSVLHPLAKRKHMEISQVFEQKLAVCGAPPWARKWIQEHYPDSSYWDAPANLISNDYKLIGQLLHSSNYCTLIAEEVFFNEIQSGEFVARRLPEAPMTHAGIVVPTGSRPGPEILEAIDIIRQIDQNVPHSPPAAPKRDLAWN